MNTKTPYNIPSDRDISVSNYSCGFLFNGKESDDELKGNGNSLDFGARIYDPRLGRFLSNDPRSKDLPSWSPYMHALDNPISVMDEDGKWPKWVHNRIIKMAFKGILTDAEIKVLQKASAHTDSKPGAQTPENSPEHYMSAPGQPATEAAKESQQFIDQKKEEYKSKDGEEALFALGEGMHTIMDGTSPAHEGSQPWEGMKGVKNFVKGVLHGIKEVNLFRKDEDKIKAAAQKIRDYYQQAQKEKQEAPKQEEQEQTYPIPPVEAPVEE
ncbi:MAG: RHS repeat-associated core domain-containing protein [Bacteroidota bacterium]|nr:RHS repeat-associated core domain-containing protein [Bacteroidota bacterium]